MPAGNDIPGLQIKNIGGGGGQCPQTPVVMHPPLENLYPCFKRVSKLLILHVFHASSDH